MTPDNINELRLQAIAEWERYGGKEPSRTLSVLQKARNFEQGTLSERAPSLFEIPFNGPSQPEKMKKLARECMQEWEKNCCSPKAKKRSFTICAIAAVSVAIAALATATFYLIE